MNTDVLSATSIMETESGGSFTLDYYIRTLNSGNKKIFALRVDKTDKETGKLLSTESSPAFSDDFARTERMAKVFAQGQVTPGVLLEMCDEWY